MNNVLKPVNEESTAREPSANARPTHVPLPTLTSLPERGGPKGPEPTRYGDWEKKGKCVDF